jgi:hypothetical protein
MTPDTTDTAARPAHTNRCYWDFTEARWVCPPGPPEAPVCTASGPFGDLTVLRSPVGAVAPLS